VENQHNVSAILINMSRINHSCLPNAEYHNNYNEARMELYSTQSIHAGEEVTINYGHNFQYMIASERNTHLSRVYGFTCKCPVCADTPTSQKSDQRCHLMREIYYCGLKGQPVAPNFSVVLNKDTSNSIEPITCVEAPRFADGINIFRPGIAGLLRREVKSMYDEGFTGSVLFEKLFMQVIASLAIMHKRMSTQRSQLPVDPQWEIQRCIQLMLASEILLRKLSPKNDPKMQTTSQTKDVYKQLWNVMVLEEMTVAECKKSIPEIMSKESDPFAEASWSSRLF
jgi:hypothetical protein